jgi:hypothetical protein
MSGDLPVPGRDGLNGPVPIFLWYQPHQSDGVLNGSIQIFAPHLLFYKTGNCTILLS